jgi:hypothetical protein
MEYLVKGGFPETCQKDDFTLREILSSLFNDILARDIAMHFSIESEKLKKVAQYLISNVSQEYSYRKVSTNIQIHADTVEKYIDYLENSFMISSLPMFSYKIKTQFRMQKKIYCVDNGLRNTVAFRTGKELGILAENLVYNELKIRGHELYYWKSMDHEIDFIISNGAEVLHLIQVAWELNDEGTIKREINGIIAAARSFNKNEGIILNKNEYKEETISNIKIKFIPIGFWLMKLIDF